MGAFVDAPIEEIVKLLEGRENARAIDLMQLHGDENEAYIRQLETYTGLPVIEVVRVRSREQILKAQELPCDYLLLDARTEDRYEDSGTQLDWNMAPKLIKPYFLASGIRLGNIKQVMSRGPYCIDVSSAAETGGRKDGRKMEEMAQVLR